MKVKENVGAMGTVDRENTDDGDNGFRVKEGRGEERNSGSDTPRAPEKTVGNAGGKKSVGVVAIGGPTASGKSRLAIALAKKLGGQVISCDSMQVYRGMDVGTGKISGEQAKGIRHRLIDIADPSQSFSLSEYIALARKAILEVEEEGDLPILCGGTGLYLDHVLMGTALSEAPADESIRRELERLDSAKLYEMLQKIDPESAFATHPNNRKRVIRALEIYRASGTTKTQWDLRSREKESPYGVKRILLIPQNRELLYGAIDARVDEMFKQGLEVEARALFERHPSPTAAQAIGYKEFLPYFSGDATLEQVKQKIKQASRNYAKRQLTWFRKMEKDALCLDPWLPLEQQVLAAVSYIQRDMGETAEEIPKTPF